MKQKIKFGILGAGHIAEAFARAIVSTEGELVAIASRSMDKANQFKAKFNIPKAYGSYEALLADDSIDCVYIATPHGLHYEHMKAALLANKHILCEKAFTLNANQAKKIFQLAKTKKRFVMEAMWTRFLPTIRTLQQRINEGMIGEVIKLEATLSFRHPIDLDSRLYAPNLGGGALLDLGVYTITLTNLFMGQPSDYLAKATMHPNGIDLEEALVAIYEDRAGFLFSSFKENRVNDAMIFGTEGWIKIEGFHRTERALIYATDGSLIQDIHYPHRVNGLEYEIQEVIACLKEGKLESAIMPHIETIAIMEQLDSIREKINLKYPQELN
jgi:predicted dehydrogenase